MNLFRRLMAWIFAWSPMLALAQTTVTQTQQTVGAAAGTSGLWVLASGPTGSSSRKSAELYVHRLRQRTDVQQGNHARFQSIV